MKTLKKVAVFSSTNGGTFKKILDSSIEERHFEVVGLITDRDCKAAEIADENGICVTRISQESSEDELQKILAIQADLFVLAGYLSKIPTQLCSALSGKLINVHPSLLPKYGGVGMYGIKVHEAVISAKEKYSGCTVHFVSEELDGGEIIDQRQIQILENEQPYELGKRVWELEGIALLDVIKNLISESQED